MGGQRAVAKTNAKGCYEALLAVTLGIATALPLSLSISSILLGKSVPVGVSEDSRAEAACLHRSSMCGAGCRYLPGMPNSCAPDGSAWDGMGAAGASGGCGGWQVYDVRAGDVGSDEGAAVQQEEDDEAVYELSEEWAERFALSELRREERELDLAPLPTQLGKLPVRL